MTTPMQRPWTDTSKSGKERIALLMAEMTLEEKMGQLGSIWYEFALFSPAGEDKEESLVDNVPIFEKVAQPLTWEDATKHGLGQFTRPFGTKPIAAADGARKIIEWQKRLVKETRLGIPAIVHEECLTGFTTLGATSFPTPLGLAATFDEKVIEKVSAAMGADMKSVGVHQGLSPVLDTVRDYRWGRVEETMGEDPYLSAVAGTAYVKGLQSAGIIATLKHFFGHSSSRAARNHGPVSMGWREMYDFMLPPFEMAIREGGVKSVMNSYTDVDGLPCAADPKIFTTILRDELNFDGTVVSDYWAISFLEVMHRVAENEADAGALSLIAGIDVELPATRCYSDGLLALIRAGKVDEKFLDRALVRVLNHKLELGLLDADWTPERDVTADLGTVNFDSASNRAVALEAARESVILLSNKDSFLPITNAPKNIVVVGPCGDDGGAFLGCYSFANHVMAMTPGSGLGIEVPSIKSAIATAFKGTDVSSVVGCPVKDFDTSAIPAARSAVDSADLAIVVVGDRAGLFGRGTSGEGNDVADLTLPGAQGQLLDTCLNSNTPVIVVSVSGRPYAMGAYADRAKAMIQAFMPGEEGGTAIAEVINGTISPSGRLPVEIPTNVSGQPSTYLHPKYGQPGLNISPVDSIPLFTFGHGLTYTTFKYSELTLSTNEISTDGKLTASCSITNTGTREGTEVVQLYFEDPVAEVARPIITLLGFARITLAPGETKKITFDIHSDRFAYMGADVVRIMDAGELILKLGSSSSDIKSSKSLTVTGSKRVVPHNRVLRTPVSIG